MPPPLRFAALPLMLTAIVGCAEDGGEAAASPALEDRDTAGSAGEGSMAPAPTDDGHDHEHAPPAPGTVPTPPADAPGTYDWNLPPGFPTPKVPDDNPMSDAKVELGRHLFYDTRLSGNGTQSCGSCHEQARAFADAKPVGIGSTGEAHTRGSMSLVNVAYATTLTWANPVVVELERQALVPLFGETPVELGLVGLEDELEQRLLAEERYLALFEDAFPEDDGEISQDTITKALASFQRTIISGDSAYDRYQQGDAGALDESAQRGMDLFFSERLECFHCHGGFNFTDNVRHVGKFDEAAFHNTALYDLDGRGSYPEGNHGLATFTEDPADMGRFKAPTLRNIALTAPYMHDGSVATLDAVIDHYAAGGRASTNPNRSEFVTGFGISTQERRDLIAFLDSLTDEALLEDPGLADPWIENRAED